MYADNNNNNNNNNKNKNKVYLNCKINLIRDSSFNMTRGGGGGGGERMKILKLEAQA